MRQGPLYFTLPITTGTKPGVADYLPAPHGLAVFANPVEQVYPALVPFIELADGRVLVATDGADEIDPAADGRSLRVVWRRWALVGGKPGELVDPHLSSEVAWRIEGATLTRDETIKSESAIRLRRWWIAVPGTGAKSEVSLRNGERWDTFSGNEGVLSVSVKADWGLSVFLSAAGDTALGRGARRALPLHLIYEARDLELPGEQSLHWHMVLKVGAVTK